MRGIANLDDSPVRARPFRLWVAPADFPPDKPLRGDLPDRLEEHGVPAFGLRQTVQHLLRREGLGPGFFGGPVILRGSSSLLIGFSF